MRKLVFLVLLSGGFGFTQDTVLEEQMEITHNIVEKMKLEVLSPKSETNISDFEQWNQSFSKSVTEALDNYEKNLRLRIFGLLSPYLKKYKKIYLSQNLSEEQKNKQLRVIKETVDSLTLSLQKEYQKIQNELYNSHSLFPHKILVTKKRNSEKADFLLSYFDDSSSKTIKYDLTKVFQPYLLSSSEKQKELLRVSKHNNIHNKDYPFYHLKLVNEYLSQLKFIIQKQEHDKYSNKWRVKANDYFYSSSNFNNLNRSTYLNAVSLFRIDFDDTFSKFYDDCSSKSCFLFKRAALLNYLYLIESEIDNNIQFDFLDLKINIKGLNRSVEIAYNRFLSRTDFSEKFNELPFFIGDK